MICPWCHEKVEIRKDGSCPECKNTVSHAHADRDANDDESLDSGDFTARIENRFRCLKCGGNECEVNEVAMTGTGLSKLFDIQYNHYLFASCLACGFVEVYNPNILLDN